MGERIKVEVNVAGSDLCIVSTESAEYVQKLAGRLNDQIEQVMAAQPSASVLDAVILAALSNLDEETRENNSSENLRAQVREYANEANRAVLELAEARREIEQLKSELGQARHGRPVQ